MEGWTEKKKGLTNQISEDLLSHGDKCFVRCGLGSSIPLIAIYDSRFQCLGKVWLTASEL